MILRKGVLACVLCTIVLPVGAAGAVPSKPSTADLLTIGVPYSGALPGKGSPDKYHWLRLPQVARNGDVFQIAVSTTQDSRFCLAPAVDDFDQSDTENRCGIANYTGSLEHVDVDGSARRTLTWTGPPSQGFLLVSGGACCPYLNDSSYTLTLEAAITRVNIGGLPLKKVKRRFSLTAYTTLGDNTPAPDGVSGSLQWRPPRKPGRPAPGWKTIGTGAVAAGKLVLSAKLPKSTAGKRVSLRACVNQPGSGSVRCLLRSPTVKGPPKPKRRR